jgi:hypothetical protein
MRNPVQAIVVSFLIGPFAALLLAAPQAPGLKATIEQQVNKEYPVTRVGANGVVIQIGSILILQEDGLKAIPATYQGYFANNVKKGARIKPNIVQHIGAGGPGEYLTDARLLQVGEKVYLTKVDIKETEIVFSVQSCGGCNPATVDPYPPFRASLAFGFGKGDLATTDFKDVKETIARIFAVESPATTPLAPTAVSAPTAASPAQSAAPEPATISMGQSKEQVAAALGQPERVAKAGNKEIYFYKDLKVTFVDGKVSDIQ